MNLNQRPPTMRYAIGVLAVVCAAAARVLFLTSIGVKAPFLTFYPAVMVAAFYGGLPAGLLATLLSALAAAIFWIEPVGRLAIASGSDWLALGVFVASGAGISWLAQAMQRAHARANEAEARAELAVQRSRADQELRRHQLLAENSRDIILYMRRDDGKILEANAAAAKAYGYSREEFESLSIHDLRAHDSRPFTDGQMAEADCSGILFQTIHRRKDGSTFPVEVSSQGATIGGMRTLISVIRDITERKKAEEELERQREWLRVTLSSIGDAVLATAYDGNITFLNRIASELTGWTEEQAMGRPVHDVFRVVDELTHEPADDIAGRVLQDGAALSLSRHLSLLTRDGREVAIQESAAPIRDAACAITGVVIVFREVTLQRRAERLRREERERLRLALDASNSGIWEWDLRTNENFWSDELWKIYGLEPHSCTPSYEAWRQVVLAEDRAMAEQQMQSAAQHGIELNVEFRVRDQDGGERWLMARAQPVRDVDGIPIRYIGIAVDITARKRAEAARLEAEARIVHYNEVLEARNDILRQAMVADTEEILCRKCLGVVEKLTQSRFGFIAEINREGHLVRLAASRPGWDISRFAIAAGCVLEGTGFYNNDPASLEEWAADDGLPPLTAFLAVPLKRDGKTIGVMAVGNREGGYRVQDMRALEDMSLGVVHVLMRKRAEKAARIAEERLRQAQKAESLGLLAGGVAHDFNNLLVSVVGSASLALELVPRESTAAELLQEIQSTGEQLAHLTRQMLAYAGKGRFVIEPLNLSELLPEMTRLAHRSIPRKVRLQLHVDDGLPMVEADRGQLQQIIVNLLVNAAESIGNEDGVITVTSGIRHVDEAYVQSHPEAAELRCGQYVCLEVRDTGCGMDESTKARIFDPFFSTKFVGRGLGLAAVAGIVRGHQGAIEVTSEPNKGSNFTVLIPASSRTRPAVAVPADRVALSGSGTVLVVDDEAVVRTMVTRALQRFGYEVLAADGGAAAVEVLRNHPGEIAAVVLDLSMPGMSGEEALRAMRAVRPEIRVLISSGYSEGEAMRLFQGQSVSGFLQKPYTLTGIAEKLKSCLT